MNEDMIVLKPIGIARTPYKDMDEAPFQGSLSDKTAFIEIDEDYVEGLKDIECAKCLIVLYWAHLAERETLRTITPWGPEIRGVFACRSPARPNPINICIVEFLGREGNRLTVRGLDAVDGSSVIDIKPYSSSIDSVPDVGIKWFDERKGRKENGTGTE